MRRHQAAAAHGIDHPRGERGSMLVVVLLMMVAVGSMVTSHLTMIVAEQNEIAGRYHAQRARARAVGALELAKNIVNTAAYVDGRNQALADAVAADPPLIAGTGVEVAPVAPGSPWFRLRAQADEHGVTRSAQVFVRHTAPISAYRLYVEDHPVAISGRPRGAIHSDRSVQIHFPAGRYRDSITAVEGFTFVAGAERTNTLLLGPHNQHAAPRGVLAGRRVSELASAAKTLCVEEELVAEVEFQGEQTEVRLYAPSYEYQVPRTGTRRVFIHYDRVPYEVSVPRYETETYVAEEPVVETETYFADERRSIFKYVNIPATRAEAVHEWRDVTYTERVPVYETRRVPRTRRERVWVPAPPPSPEALEGGVPAVGGTPRLGHFEWRTLQHEIELKHLAGYKNVQRNRRERVKVGEKTVGYTKRTKIFSHYETCKVERRRQVQTGTREVTRTRSVPARHTTETRYRNEPRYRTETYTYFETRTMPERLVRTETVATAGILYFAGPVRAVGGEVNGRVTIATSGDLKITDSIVYVDDDGDTRMLHGLDPDSAYLPNPAYDGRSVVGLMAQGDILYARHGPERIEINAALLSVGGKVAYEGITVSADGTTVSYDAGASATPDDDTKESLRRLGGVVSKLRPVASHVDDRNQVIAGYRSGTALMDHTLTLQGGGQTPPGAFEESRPVWSMLSVGKELELQ